MVRFNSIQKLFFLSFLYTIKSLNRTIQAFNSIQKLKKKQKKKLHKLCFDSDRDK